MATLPTRILEIEFDAGVWTNVTADMVDIGSRRGRNRESGAFETGHFMFTLRNDARKYDPENTAGPYYSKLRPNRRCRLRATYNAVTYPVWVGYIDRISQVAGGPNDAAAVFDASDFFKLLNRVELPPSVYAAEVATADEVPTALWPLDEPAGSTTATDTGVNRVQLPATGPITFGVPGIAVRDPSSAMQITATGQYLMRTGPFVMTGTPLAIELLYQHTPAGAVGLLAGQTTADAQDSAYLGIVGTNVVFVVRRAGGTLGTQVSTGVNVTDGSPHHIVGTWDAAGAVKIWIDGVDRTSAPLTITAGAFGQSAGETFIGAPAGGSFGTYQFVAFYNGAVPSSATMNAHNTAARTPWNGDLPGTRLVRIFELAGGGSYLIDPGTTPLQSTDLGGTALAYAQKVEETELGALFVTRDGDVRFLDRQTAVTGAYLTPQFTLVDDDSGAGIPYRSADADVDEGVIVTRATASREGSVAVIYYDAAAQDEFGWLDETHDGLLYNSDAYSLGYAQWIVNTHKSPSSRVGTVTLELTKDPAAMYPAILALELGDRVTFKRKPQNVGAVTTIDMRVEAISHETGSHYWRTRLQLSPFNLAAGLPVGVWDVTTWDQSVWGI